MQRQSNEDSWSILAAGVRDYGIAILDTQGHIESWNIGAEALSGYQADEVIGKNFALFSSHNKTQADQSHAMLSAAAAEGSFVHQNWHRRKDGTNFLAEMRIAPLYYDDGSLRGFGQVVSDLSKPMTCSPMLTCGDDVHRLIDSIRDYAIFMLNTEGTITSWNLGAQKIFGHSREEILGKHFGAFFPAEDMAAGKPYAMLELAKKDGSEAEEGWRVRRDGTLFWASVLVSVQKDNDGQFHGFSIVIRDITERRRLEEQRILLGMEQAARQEAESVMHRYRLITETVPQIVWTAKPDGAADYFNRRWVEQTGLSLEQSLGWGWHMVFHSDDRERCLASWTEALRLGQNFETEGRLRQARSDDYRWYLVRALPIHEPEGGAILQWFGSFTDIDAQKRAQAERELLLERERTAREEAARLYQQAADANLAKDQFLATMSHELRTPMNAIIGWSRILREGVLPPETLASVYESIDRNAQLEAKLINDVLQFSEIITGRLQLKVQAVSMSTIVEAAIDALRLAMEAKQQQVSIQVQGAVDFVTGDPDRLQQCVWNLLSNATKFTPERGHITLVLWQDEGTVALSVTDDGEGLSEDFQKDVFKSFVQEDGSYTRTHGGLGLGLAIVKHIVELHGGTVAVSSPGKGHGSSFTIRLPAMTQEAHREPTAKSKTETQPSSHREMPGSLHGCTILLVDDDPDVLDVIGYLLEDSEASLIKASSADEAYETFVQEKPDLLVCDIGMPGKSGYDLISRIRLLSAAEGGSVPAVALTAHATEEDRRRALAEGFDLHISKPADPVRLPLTLASLWQLRQQGRTNASERNTGVGNSH